MNPLLHPAINNHPTIANFHLYPATLQRNNENHYLSLSDMHKQLEHVALHTLDDLFPDSLFGLHPPVSHCAGDQVTSTGIKRFSSTDFLST